MRVFAREDCRSGDKKPKRYGIDRAKLILFVAVLAFCPVSSAPADQWVTRKNPKHGYKFLGRVVVTLEIRADGTVKKAWPSSANVRAATAWRVADAAQELTFPRGAPRKIQLPVTVYLE